MSLQIKVNGTQIPLTEFPEEIMTNVLCGMVRSLKGVQEIHDVEISLKV